MTVFWMIENGPFTCATLPGIQCRMTASIALLPERVWHSLFDMQCFHLKLNLLSTSLFFLNELYLH